MDSAPSTTRQHLTGAFRHGPSSVRRGTRPLVQLEGLSMPIRTGFFDLPPELRNMIYNEYFSSYSGHMIARYERAAQFSSDEVSPPEIVKRRNTNTSPEHTLGPMSLLLASKSIHIEAHPIFVYSTVFSFDCPADMSHFVHQQRSLGGMCYVRTVFIDLQDRRTPLFELKQMLELTKSMPSLASVEIRVDLGDGVGRSSATSTKLDSLRHLMFDESGFRQLSSIKSIILKDPNLEKDLHVLKRKVVALWREYLALSYEQIKIQGLVDEYIQMKRSVCELRNFNRELQAGIEGERRSQDTTEEM